jgi:xylulokinase
MFLSPIFREAFANTIGVPVELYDTDGATGAALGAGIGAGMYSNATEAFRGLNRIDVEEPTPGKMDEYKSIYERWRTLLIHELEKQKFQ